MDLISRRISSKALEMKLDSPRSWRRKPLIRSSRLRWNKLSIIEVEDEDIDSGGFAEILVSSAQGLKIWSGIGRSHELKLIGVVKLAISAEKGRRKG